MNKKNERKASKPYSSGICRIIIAGHWPALAMLFALTAFPSLFHDITRDVLANADMDLFATYQALLLNAGLPLLPGTHTGYLFFLSLAGWFQLLNFFSLLSFVDMNSILAAADFNGALAQLIVAGRHLSIILAFLLSAMVYAALFMAHPNRLHAFLLSVLFTIGAGGLAAQSVMMRTELPSMVLLFSAAMALVAATRISYIRALGLLVVAGFLVHAAMMVKVQVAIVLLFLPALAFVFGWEFRARPLVVPSRPARLAILVGALVVSVPVATVYYKSLIPESQGLYQLAIAAFVLSSTLAYGHFILGHVRHGMMGFAAVAAGFSLAYGLIAISGQWWTTYSIVNFVEFLTAFQAPVKAGSTLPPDGGIGTNALITATRKLASGLELSKINSFFAERLRNFDYPFLILYIAMPVAAVFLAVKRKFHASLKVGYLCFMAGMTVLIFWAGRGMFNFFYSIYIEAWVILAAGIILKELPLITVSWPELVRRSGRAFLVLLLFSIITVNTHFRLMDPAAASSAVAKNACIIRFLTPLIYEKFNDYCKSG